MNPLNTTPTLSQEGISAVESRINTLRPVLIEEFVRVLQIRGGKITPQASDEAYNAAIGKTSKMIIPNVMYNFRNGEHPIWVKITHLHATLQEVCVDKISGNPIRQLDHISSTEVDDAEQDMLRKRWKRSWPDIMFELLFFLGSILVTLLGEKFVETFNSGSQVTTIGTGYWIGGLVGVTLIFAKFVR